VSDITSDILAEVTLPQVEPEEVDLQAVRFDHLHDLSKHAPDEDRAVDGSDGSIRGQTDSIIKMK